MDNIHGCNLNALRVVDSPERSAYHEAGHAVAFHFLGLGVDSVTIEVDRVNRTAGATARRVDGGNVALAIATLAGPLATKRWTPSRADWRSGAESDFRSIEEHIDAAVAAEGLPLHAHALRRAELATHVRNAAERLVECYWTEISRVANALALSRTLDGARVGALCGGAR